jgi:N-acetylmuramoyl-L-alanine amidase
LRGKTFNKMDNTKQESDVWAVGWSIRTLVLITFVAAFAVPLGLVPIIAVATSEAQVPVQVEGPITVLLSTPEPTPTPVPAFTPTPSMPRVGIIAGHAGSDSGAVCDDGLQEVQVNTDIARRVVANLTNLGWDVMLLDEFDTRLYRYVGDALLSIHADSCGFPGKSGFKIARAESSYIPIHEDRLVNCIIKHYQEETGLEFDANTITYDMTQYHAYTEIDPSTPAAIIEVGFMLDDRELLTEKPDIIALGIVKGLQCFINGDEP